MGLFSRIFFWRRNARVKLAKAIILQTCSFMHIATVRIRVKDLEDDDIKAKIYAFMGGAVSHACLAAGFAPREASECLDYMSDIVFGDDDELSLDLITLYLNMDIMVCDRFTRAGAAAMRDFCATGNRNAPLVLMDLLCDAIPVEPQLSKEADRGTV